MKINDIKSNDPFLLEGPLDWLSNKFTDRQGDQEFKHYKEGLMNDYIRWANLTAGSKDTNDVNLITQWLTSQYGLNDSEVAQALGGAKEDPQAQDQQQDQAQGQDQNQQQAKAAEPEAQPAQTTAQGQQQAAPADTAQADKIKANLAANQKARQGGGNSMDLNKWYQDYQAEQTPVGKMNLVKELVNRVADYGPQDIDSMKAILKRIRNDQAIGKQGAQFIDSALQRMGQGKDMAATPQGTAKPQAKPAQQPAGPTASAQADQGKPGFMQSKIKGVQRPAAPAFTKQTVNNSVMYHVNAIVEALGFTMEELGYAVLKESATTSTIYNKAMLTESQLMELDVPRAPSTLGKVAGTIGGAIGGAKGMWQGAKDAFAGQKAAANTAQRNDVAGSDAGASGGAGAGGNPAMGGSAGGAMAAGGGDLWDKITRLMYKSGKLETNPRNNMKNKMANAMLKGTGMEFDDTKGMARGGYAPSGAQAGGTAPAAGSTATPAKGQGTAPAGQTKAQGAPAAGGGVYGAFAQAGGQAADAGAAGGTDTGAEQPAADAQAQAGQAPAGQQAQGADQAPADQAQGGEVTGTLDAKQLATMLPGVDAMGIARGIADIKAGKQVGAKQKQAFGDAMMALIKADPSTTVKVMNSLAKMSAGQGAASGNIGQQAPTSGFDAKGNAKTESAIDRRAKLMASKIFNKARLK
jgi:hypothetical protein